MSISYFISRVRVRVQRLARKTPKLTTVLSVGVLTFSLVGAITLPGAPFGSLGAFSAGEADISAEFSKDSTSVTATSSKELSNVVLEFCDGSQQKFDGLTDRTGTFTGTGDHAGKVIVTAWVKSGGFLSGDGPGFGERFDNADAACDHEPEPAPHQCPAPEGAIVVTFPDGSKLFSGGPTELPPVAVDIPAGTYRVTLGSFDTSHPGVDDKFLQDDEQYFVVLLDADGNEVAQTNPISDLPDDKVSLIEVVNEELKTAAATSVVAKHASPDREASNDRDSIFASCMTLEPVTEPKPALTIEKTADPTTVNPGGQVTYSVTVKNTGNGTAVNVTLTDVLPGDFTYTDLPGKTTRSWNLGNLTADTDTTVTYQATVANNAPEGGFTNTAETKADNHGSLSDTATVHVVHAPEPEPKTPQLTIEKTVSENEVAPGAELTYTLTVENTGEGTAVNVVLQDVLPDGIVYKDTGATGLRTWNLGNLAPGAETTTTFKALVVNTAEVGDYENTAEAKAANHGKVVDTATVAVTTTPKPQPKLPELTIDKNVSDTNVEPGAELTYTITVSNTGEGKALNVLVADKLPDGIVYNDTGDNAMRTWNLGHLDADESKTVTFEALVSNTAAAGDYTNTAVANAANHGTVSDKTTVTVTTQPTTQQNPTLTINKTASTASVSAGGNVTYTVTLTNTGEGTAVNVTLTDVLPQHFVYTDLPSQTTRSWNLGNLAPGATNTASYQATVANNTPAGDYTNTARAQAANHDEVSDTATVSVTTTPPPAQPSQPALTIDKTASVAFTNPGATISYTIVVTNAGPGTALNAVLTDVLPSDFFYTDLPSATTRSWNLGNLNPGSSRTTTYQVGISDTARQAFHVNVAHVNATNHGTVSDTARVEVRNGEIIGETALPELAVTKTAQDAFVNAGGTTTFTIHVVNNGEAPAENITVTDTLPPHFTEQGSGNQTVTFSAGTLFPGQSFERTITVAVAQDAPAGTYRNFVTARADNHDPVETSADIEVRAGQVLAATTLPKAGAADEMLTRFGAIVGLLMLLSGGVYLGFIRPRLASPETRLKTLVSRLK